MRVLMACFAASTAVSSNSLKAKEKRVGSATVLRTNHSDNLLVNSPFGLTTKPLPLLAPLYTTSTISISSCLSVIAQLILLLFPVPKSIMMCLLR